MNKALLVFLLSISLTLCLKPGTLSQTAAHDTFTILYDVDTEDASKIWFEVSGTNPGWVALGHGSTGGMETLDVYMFQYLSGEFVVTDRYVNGFAEPQEDAGGVSNQHIMLDTSGSSFDSNTNAWVISFNRELNTGDSEDAVLYCGMNNYVLALSQIQETDVAYTSPDVQSSYHGPQGYTFFQIDINDTMFDCEDMPVNQPKENSHSCVLYSSLTVVLALITFILF